MQYSQQYSPPQQAQAPAMPYSQVYKRFFAFLIDELIILVFYIIGLVIFHTLALPGYFLLIVLVMYKISTILYRTIMEATLGATLGKLALGLRVVKTNGTFPIGWAAALIRNLLRIVDGLFTYLIGLLIICDSPLKQRLGDKAAETIVISTRSTSQVHPGMPNTSGMPNTF